jgi:uncharacterized repeat protein (TIGR01451 family)
MRPLIFLKRLLLPLFILVPLVNVTAAKATVAKPAWSIQSVATPTNFVPGDESNNSSGTTGSDSYQVYVTNSGSRPTDGTPITIIDTLPRGVTFVEVSSTPSRDYESGTHLRCAQSGLVVSCVHEGGVPAGDTVEVKIIVAVEPLAAGQITNAVSVSGGGLATASIRAQNEINTIPARFGINSFSFSVDGVDGMPDVQAGGHPYAVSTTLNLNTEQIPSERRQDTGSENPKDVVVDLPIGFIGDPQAAAKCPINELEEHGGAEFNTYECPADSKIGEVNINTALADGIASSIAGENSSLPVSPLYNLSPEYGHAAEFGFDVGKVIRVHLYGGIVRTSDGYVLRVTTPNAPSEFIYPEERGFLGGVTLTFFGDPNKEDGRGGPPAAFFTNPTNCPGTTLATSLHLDTWTKQGSLTPDDTPDFSDPNWLSAVSSLPAVSNCRALQFSPTLSVQPDTTQADAPTGATLDLAVPQAPSNDEVLATPPLKDAVVTLPQGLVLSPSAANGLQACSEAELGFENGEVNNSQPACPEASKVGTVELTTPLLEKPISGSVYLSEQGNNPFGSLVALYLVVDDPTTGVLIKLPGEVHLDPVTGQITATFDNNPQLPFSELTLKFKVGPRAPLVTPSACGSYTTTSELTPWSAPQSGPPATPSDGFAVNSDCVSGFAPSLVAGTTSNQAGAYSPYTLALSRQDGEQNLKGLEATLPQGLLAKLAGVQQCGNTEADAGACPMGSRIGSVTVAAGAGADPVLVHGEIFLTGPYNGGPFGEVVEVPAVAGPFNLGLVVVRGSIRVNPTTVQASVVSDPFPTILDGIPLQVKTVNVTLEREGFTFNPTNCEPLASSGTVTSLQGAQTAVTSHFRASNCATLPFKPMLAVSTAGRSSKAGGASLDVRITSKGGAGATGEEANIRSVKVDLPIKLPSRLTTLQKACLAKIFEADPAFCPKESDVGTASASTPVLANPLAGPAYLVSHGGEAFPSLEIVLQGEGVELILEGKTDIKKGVTSSTFRTVPDAPISSFELKLPTGRYSVLGTNLPTSAHYSFCGQTLALPTAITGQNGAVSKPATKVSVTGCPKAKKAAAKSTKAKKSGQAQPSNVGEGRKV